MTDTGISDLIAADCCMASNSPITGIVGTGANFHINRRPGFNRVVKQLRFWLFKVDCEFKDCDLRVLRIGHTCVICILIIASSEKNRNSQSLNYAIETRPTVAAKLSAFIRGVLITHSEF